MKGGLHVFSLCKENLLILLSLVSPCCGGTVVVGFVDS